MPSKYSKFLIVSLFAIYFSLYKEIHICNNKPKSKKREKNSSYVHKIEFYVLLKKKLWIYKDYNAFCGFQIIAIPFLDFLYI